jgi:hypothetical protein
MLVICLLLATFFCAVKAINVADMSIAATSSKKVSNKYGNEVIIDAAVADYKNFALDYHGKILSALRMQNHSLTNMSAPFGLYLSNPPELRDPIDWEDLRLKLAFMNDATSSGVIKEASKTPPPFTCAVLPQKFDPHYFCSSVVDYPFILPQGVTVADMEVAVRQSVASLISFINAPCLSDYKRLMCAETYLPCVPNGKQHFAVRSQIILVSF